MKRLMLTTLAATLGLTMLAPVAMAQAQASLAAFELDQPSDPYDRRGRKKKRVPGGSGCDDPGDVIEHPECRRR